MTNKEDNAASDHEIWFETALDYDLRSYLAGEAPDTRVDKRRYHDFQRYVQAQGVSLVQPLFDDDLLTPTERTAHRDGEKVPGAARLIGKALKRVASDGLVRRVVEQLAALPRRKALALLARYQDEQPLLSRYYRLRVPWPVAGGGDDQKQRQPDPVAALRGLPGVLGAFTAPVVRRDAAPLSPKDPLFLNVNYQEVVTKPIRPELRGQWNLHAINTPSAWQFTTGAGVTVAVVDTGVFPPRADAATPEAHDLHPELRRALLPGSDPDVLDAPGKPGKKDPHGTQVAGIIAAAADGAGMVGVAPDAKILSLVDGGLTLKQSPTSRAPEGAEWLAGLVRAAREGAQVINCSWHLELPCCAGRSQPMAQQVVKDAIAAVMEEGAVVVCSMGNQSHYNTPRPYTCWPAALNGQQHGGTELVVIAVGGVVDGPDGLVRHIGSNYGPAMTVVAPGHEVPTTDFIGRAGINDGAQPGGGLKDFANYAPLGGTSAAAAHVSGVVALMLEVNPRLTPAQVRAHLQKTAIPVGTLLSSGAARDDLYGHGLVNAGAAARVAGEVALRRIIPHLPDFDDLDERMAELLLDNFMSHTLAGHRFAGRLWQVSEELATLFDDHPDTAAEVLELFERLYPMQRALSGRRRIAPPFIARVQAIRLIRRIAAVIRAEKTSSALDAALGDLVRAATHILRQQGSLLEAVGADAALR